MVMPMCSTSKNMFPEEKWDLKKYSDDCFKKFGVRPREHAAVTYYGDKSLTYVFMSVCNYRNCKANNYIFIF